VLGVYLIAILHPSLSNFYLAFQVFDGVIRDSDKFFFDLVGDNSFSNFLYQYYSTHKIPKFIIVSEFPENQKLLESLLSEQSGFIVKIMTPTRGKKNDI
jgi:excinuclease ABC subunit C